MLICATSLVAQREISLPHLTAIWLPGGIALAALVTRPGWKALPTIFLSHWVVMAYINQHSIFVLHPYGLLLCGVNTLEPALGCLIWKRWLKEPPFEHGWSFLKFTFGVSA